MKKSALLIIDVQNDMFEVMNPIYNGDSLLTKLKLLIEQARSNDIPIFFIQHNEPAGRALENGTTGWEIHKDIKPLKEDFIIQKNTPDSFHETNLEAELSNLSVNHLILSGIQSDLCVDTTCRRAFSLGYEVTLVKDAHSTWKTDELTAQQVINHHNQVLQWFAETVNASEVLKKTTI